VQAPERALRATLGETFRPAFEGSQAVVVLPEGGTFEEPARRFVDSRDGDRCLVGIYPYEYLYTCAYLRFDRTSATNSARRTLLLLRAVHISFESLCTPRAPAGRKPKTSQPVSHGQREVRERSLHNRHPRRLAAADHQAPDQS
jgi:hypothetical protein